MRKMNKLFSLMASLALAAAVSPALAQTAAATPAAPTVTVGGMVDTYINYNFTNSNAGMNGAGNKTAVYFYNANDDSFTLGLAEAKITASQGPASAHLVLADISGNPVGLNNSGLDVLQAYVSYNPDQWTFTAGQFVTWLGEEVIESSSNWNYSRSLLFQYAIPYWHTGLSVGYNTTDSKLGLTGYVVDGWNNYKAPSSNFGGPNWINLGKTYGLQVSIKPESTVGILLNGIAGPQGGIGGVATNNGAAMWVAEGIVSYNPTSAWSFALDFNYDDVDLSAPVTVNGNAVNAKTFWGAALYGRYQIQSDWAAALRLEMLKDNYNFLGVYGAVPVGATAQDVTSQEGTLTVEHNFSTNLLLRLEGRMDMASSSGGSYTSGTGSTNPGPFAGGSATQVTGSASAVFSF